MHALDDISGVYQLSISADQTNWTDWETFVTEKTYTIPPMNGEKTIYFRVKDQVGNIAKPITSTIILNITAPPETTIKVPKVEDLGAGYLFCLSIIIIIIVIIVVVILAVVLMLKRRKRQYTDHGALPAGTLTIRPGGLSTPVISVGQVPGTLRVPQLLGSTLLNSIDDRPFGGAASTGAASVPQLMRTTQVQTLQTTGAVSGAAPHAAPALPQLPPAKLMPTSITTIATPTVAPTITPQAQALTPSPTPSPTPVQPQTQPTTKPQPQAQVQVSQLGSTPKVGQPPVVTTAPGAQTPGPAVHLPDAQTTAKPPTGTPSIGTTSTQQMLKNLQKNE
jgi:hypothetical protein